MRLRPALVAAALTAALAAPAARAQDASVRDQLDRLVGRLSDEGYEQSHLRRMGRLNDDGTQTYTVNLQRGKGYAVAGVCDNDCSDLDLILLDNRGRVVDQDDSTDDAPVVTVTPSKTGTYRVRVRMYECSVDPCSFGLVVFSN